MWESSVPTGWPLPHTHVAVARVGGHGGRAVAAPEGVHVLADLGRLDGAAATLHHVLLGGGEGVRGRRRGFIAHVAERLDPAVVLLVHGVRGLDHVAHDLHLRSLDLLGPTEDPGDDEDPDHDHGDDLEGLVRELAVLVVLLLDALGLLLVLVQAVVLHGQVALEVPVGKRRDDDEGNAADTDVGGRAEGVGEQEREPDEDDRAGDGDTDRAQEGVLPELLGHLLGLVRVLEEHQDHLRDAADGRDELLLDPEGDEVEREDRAEPEPPRRPVRGRGEYRGAHPGDREGDRGQVEQREDGGHRDRQGHEGPDDHGERQSRDDPLRARPRERAELVRVGLGERHHVEHVDDGRGQEREAPARGRHRRVLHGARTLVGTRGRELREHVESVKHVHGRAAHRRVRVAVRVADEEELVQGHEAADEVLRVLAPGVVIRARRALALLDVAHGQVAHVRHLDVRLQVVEELAHLRRVVPQGVEESDRPRARLALELGDDVAARRALGAQDPEHVEDDLPLLGRERGVVARVHDRALDARDLAVGGRGRLGGGAGRRGRGWGGLGHGASVGDCCNVGSDARVLLHEAASGFLAGLHFRHTRSLPNFFGERGDEVDQVADGAGRARSPAVEPLRHEVQREVEKSGDGCDGLADDGGHLAGGRGTREAIRERGGKLPFSHFTNGVHRVLQPRFVSGHVMSPAR